MDHAVSLVQAYLQLNGYFTSAEYPIIAGAGRNGFRTITDIDILAFRFPSGLPTPQGRHTPKGLNVSELDDGLGVGLRTRRFRRHVAGGEIDRACGRVQGRAAPDGAANTSIWHDAERPQNLASRGVQLDQLALHQRIIAER